MELSEFLRLNNPAEYNFELENKVLRESDLDTYSRYFIYKASTDQAKKSGYEKGRQFSEDISEKYGCIADCDGTLGTGEDDTCMLTRELYRNLWGWKDSEEGKIKRYGFVTFDKFGLFGPETMNSAQTTVNSVIKDAFEKCNNDDIIMLKKGRVSANFMLELFSNDCSNESLRSWLDDIKGLYEFLNLYHTLGNFVLVPAYFNTYRASVVYDYWDKSLALLENKTKVWTSKNNEIQWDKDLYIRYVNYFFLWDYTEEYKTKIISDIYDTDDLECFLEATCKKIRRRGDFMVAMLKIQEINPQYYIQLTENIFNTDRRYKNYEDVIEAIKNESCYSDEKVKRIIKLLEEAL